MIQAKGGLSKIDIYSGSFFFFAASFIPILPLVLVRQRQCFIHFTILKHNFSFVLPFLQTILPSSETYLHASTRFWLLFQEVLQ